MQIIESLILAPVLIPPIVLGFFFLLLLGPHSPLSPFFTMVLGHSPLYHFSGLVCASMGYSFPLMFTPIIAALEQLPHSWTSALYTLGYQPSQVFKKAIIPWLKPTIMRSGILGFSHTLGAFGVLLLVGGNIPGKTQVLSIYLFQQIELLHYREVMQVSIILLASSIILMSLLRKSSHA